MRSSAHVLQLHCGLPDVVLLAPAVPRPVQLAALRAWRWCGAVVFTEPVVLAGVKGRRIRELTSVVQKRFKFPEGSVELYAEKVANRGLCSVAQAESLRYKLLGGLAVRRHALLRVLHWLGLSGEGSCGRAGGSSEFGVNRLRLWPRRRGTVASAARPPTPRS